MPKTTTARTRTSKQRGLIEGYRSGLEDKVGAQLSALGVPVKYESVVLRYKKPAKDARYTPDWPLPNDIIIETKGRFVTADRQKHLLIKQQYPDLDIRFVFSNSKTRISKKSKTTYAMWCEKNGFKYADKLVPEEWVREPACPRRSAALREATKKGTS